jgi:hypothetical protein
MPVFGTALAMLNLWRTYLMGCKMTIYQVLDENNYFLKEYQQREMALRCSEVLTELFPNHQYHVEELVWDEPSYAEQN